MGRTTGNVRQAAPHKDEPIYAEVSALPALGVRGGWCMNGKVGGMHIRVMRLTRQPAQPCRELGLQQVTTD